MNTKARTEPSRHFRVKRAHRPWLNAYRYALHPTMKATCLRVQAEIENYETAPVAVPELRRKRRRRGTTSKPDQMHFHMLVEAVVCELARQRLLTPDDPTILISRGKDYLSNKSRYTPDYLGKAFTHILDVMARPELDLIEQELGTHIRGTKLGTATMIKPTKRLSERFNNQNIQIDSMGLRAGEEVIVLRGTKESRDDTREWVQYEDTDFTNGLRRDLKRINDFLEKADIQVDEIELNQNIDPTAVRMRRLFTMSSFETGGRLYHGFWQRLSRQERQDAITLDGERTVTLDFSQMALRIAYGMVGADLPAGDGYILEGLAGYRSAIKKLTNALLFPRKANWKLLIPKRIRKALPEDVDDQYVIDMIMTKHKALKSLWLTDAGHHIQRIESDIIVDCILQCIDQNIIALQVHDALIIPESRLEAVKQIMLETFERHTGIVGEVTTE